MISEDTKLAIKGTWAIYAEPPTPESEEQVTVGLAVLSDAPEAYVAKLGEEALSFWKGYLATCEHCHPLLRAARLRGVDDRLKELVRKVNGENE